MTPREIVSATIEFRGPERLARSFPGEYGNDFAGCSMNPNPDGRPGKGVDEWGAVWENIGVCHLGEVKEFPLREWADLDRIRIPFLPKWYGDPVGAGHTQAAVDVMCREFLRLQP